MKLLDHLDGLRAAATIWRALDPDLPRLPGSPVSLLRRFRANAWALLDAAAGRGPVVRADLLYKSTLIVQHPDAFAAVFEQPDLWLRGDGLVPLIGRNTLTTNGEAWAFNRRAIQPSFHPRMTARAADDFSERAEAIVDGWTDAATAGRTVDLAELAVRLFARLGPRAFGIEVTDDEADRLPEALLRTQRWAFRVLAGGARRTAQAAADLALLEGIVARALQAPAPSDAPPSLVERLRQDHAVARDTLRDHLMLLLIAPTDNPPNAFAFLGWLLSRHPAHQEAARAEVQAVLGDGPVTAEAIEHLPLLDRVLQESLRLLPPVWWLARNAVQDTVLDGFRVPAGTLAFTSIWRVHRDPDFWERPEIFDPDRFLPAAIEARHRFAWLPFGVGPRTCIGTRFATTEIRILLAHFLRRFRALPAGPATLPLHGAFALRSQIGVPVRLERLAAGDRR